MSQDNVSHSQRMRPSSSATLSGSPALSRAASSSSKSRRKLTVPRNIDEHKIPLSDVCERYSVVVDTDVPGNSLGLSEETAAERLKEFGHNVLQPPESKPAWRTFLDCLLSLFNILLLVAALLSVVLFIIHISTSKNEVHYPDLVVGLCILIITLINTIIEFVEIRKSQAIVSAFMNLVPSRCSVVRNGELQQVLASDLVIGDVVFVKMGDKVPADILLFYTAGELKVDNSSLTGESEPQERLPTNTQSNPLEATNLAFNSSLIVSGEGYGIVIRTGDDTMIGQIAGMTQGEAKRQSPLTQEIESFVKLITGIAVSSAVILIIVMLSRGGQKSATSIVNFSIGVLLAWVPQGLPLTVTMLLKTASTRMIKKNVVVKNLTAVETLGAITLLATDKTGTLTKNQMTVSIIWTQLKLFETSSYRNGVDKNDRRHNMFAPVDIKHPGIRKIAEISGMCSSARFGSTEVPISERQIFGDATETGLFRLASQLLEDEFDQLASNYPKVFEIPFNSDTKIHMSIHRKSHENGVFTVYVKGAPERVLVICSRILSADGKSIELTEMHKKLFWASYEQMARQGHRVLAFAEFLLPESEYSNDFVFSRDDENYPKSGFSLVGLSSLEDPPKHGVREAVGNCRRAGIKVVMVTGDHPLTAEAIARKINLMITDTKEQMAKNAGIDPSLVDEGEVDAIVIHGEKIDTLTNDEWDIIFSKSEIIFARTSPKHKLTIVKKAQSLGHVVGVTGDGVNDSPALKKADLGIAMNMSGSDVSKEAASMILLDDNFASIIHGILEGRLIFTNIKKSVQYILSHIVPEVLPQFLFALGFLPAAIGPLQILAIDMGFELIAALSYAWEPSEDEKMMMLPPRRPVTMQSIDYLRKRAAFDDKYRPNKKSCDPENGKNKSRKRSEDVETFSLMSLSIGQKIKQKFSLEYWRRFGSPLAPNFRGETLVDKALLSYSYLEAGLIQFLGATIAYYVTVQSVLNGKIDSVQHVQACLDSFDNTNISTPNGCIATKEELKNAEAIGQTMFFISVILIQMFNLFACKCRISYPFRSYIFKNKVTWLSIVIGSIVAVAVIAIPKIDEVMGTSIKVVEHLSYIYIPLITGVVIFLWSAFRFFIRNLLFPLRLTPEPAGLQMHPTRWSRT